MIVFHLPGTERLGRLPFELGASTGEVEIHHFPDGESRLRLLGEVEGKDVVLVGELERPDRKILTLLFAVATARELGARSIGVVAPYLPYMRQDRAFRSGEGVTARQFTRLLTRDIDWLATVDPHLHRIRSLGDVCPVPTETVHTAPLLAEWIRRHVERPLILGPDGESHQWVASVAELVGAPHMVMTKRRVSDCRVELTLPPLARHAGRQPVLVDDIVSSGATMAAAVRALTDTGWPAPVCLVVHALFAPGALDLLRAAGAATVVSTNTVSHATNAVDVGGLLAEAVSRRVSQRAPAGIEG
jgi:ribose-phosphate pyrophosphokinase